MTETTQKGPTGAEIRKLVERGQKGDRTALEELYLIHFDRIYSYLHMTVGNRHDAEDLTTQTFLRMLESIGKFRLQAAPFSAWLFRIAHNLSMDHFRANQSKLHQAFEESIGNNPLAKLAQQNIAMFKAAASAFIPGAEREVPAAKDEAPADDLDALRQQMADMQKKLDALGK